MRALLFLEQKTNTDAYYDNEQYAVTSADRWLRNRNGSFELKVPLSKDNGSQGVNVYHELTEEADIREALRLPYDTSDLAHDIEAAGYRVFVQPTSSRRSYEKDGYHIDVDTVAYEGSDFTYAVAEIELLVQDALVRRVHVDEHEPLGVLREDVDAVELAERVAERGGVVGVLR